MCFFILFFRQPDILCGGEVAQQICVCVWRDFVVSSPA